MTKTMFRQNAFAVRDDIPVEKRLLLSAQTCEAAQPLLKEAKTVMLYKPIRSELDISCLFEWLWKRGVSTLLPSVMEDRIVAALYSADSIMKTGPYNIEEPVFDRPFEPMEIDVCLVPGIAFTRAGDRMGYGAGYYDRFLPQTRAKRIGICFPQQVYNTIPTEEYDRKMHLVVTADDIFRS